MAEELEDQQVERGSELVVKSWTTLDVTSLCTFVVRKMLEATKSRCVLVVG